METRKILAIWVLGLAVMVWPINVSQAAPVGTAFTFQGLLKYYADYADGLYDFEFKLYDANSDGNQVGSSISMVDANVVDGHFKVDLDFGSVFDGNAVWLEIHVGPTNPMDPNLIRLEPRVELTPTPYALYALNAETTSGDGDWAISDKDMYSIPPGNVGIGTSSPSAKLDVSGDVNTASVYRIGGNQVLSASGTANIFVGEGAGANNTGAYSTFVGHNAGYNNQGNDNTFLGRLAGYFNTTGHDNTFVGRSAGYRNDAGNYNTFVGRDAGLGNIAGNYNTVLGYDAGQSNDGSENTFLGNKAGYSNVAGSGNVFIGSEAGYNETDSDRLYIANGRADSDVLIYGDFSTGRVGIGTTNPTHNLEVSSPQDALRVGNANSWLEVRTMGNTSLSLADGAGNRAGYILGGENATGENVLKIAACTDGGSCPGYITFHESGYVGIGTSSPGRHLDVAGHITAYTYYDRHDPNYYVNPGTALGTSAKLAGDVVIGTTSSPVGRLDVRGDEVRIWDGSASVDYARDPGELYVENDLEVDGNVYMQNVYNTGFLSGRSVLVRSSGQLGYLTSSKRYKENIAPLQDDFSKILRAQPVTFTARESKERGLGFIAEDMDELGLHNLVVYDNKGRPDSIRYELMSLYLLEVIKDQANSVEELKTQNESLKHRLDALERTVQQFANGKEVQL